MEALLIVAEHDGPTMFARIGVMRALNRACFTRRSENGKSFPKTGNFFPRRTNGIPEKRYSNRVSACAFEPARRVAGDSVSLHASFTNIDALT